MHLLKYPAFVLPEHTLFLVHLFMSMRGPFLVLLWWIGLKTINAPMLPNELN